MTLQRRSGSRLDQKSHTTGRKRTSGVDYYVGQRLRLRRQHLSLSQSSLGERVGLTFQQIQKYERGLNRISASRLYEFAGTLNVPIAFFFEGLPELKGGDDPSPETRRRADYAASAEGMQVLDAFVRLPLGLRKDTLRLLTTFTQSLLKE